MLFFTHFKVSVPCLWAGHILQASLWEWVSTQELPSASVGQFAQLTQSLEVFCTLLQSKVHQSHKHLCSPNLWNILIMAGFTQFLLKYPPGIFVLGQITLPIKDSRNAQERVEGAGVGFVCKGHTWTLKYLFPSPHATTLITLVRNNARQFITYSWYFIWNSGIYVFLIVWLFIQKCFHSNRIRSNPQEILSKIIVYQLKFAEVMLI